MSTTKRTSKTDKAAASAVLAYAEKAHRLGLVAAHPALYVSPLGTGAAVHDAAFTLGRVAVFESEDAAYRAVHAARVAARESGIAA